MLNYKLFSQGMIRLNNFFKKTDNSELFLKDYHNAIKELNSEQFNRGVEFLIKTFEPSYSEAFPTPSKLLKAVKETALRVEVTPAQFQIAQAGVPMPENVKKMRQEFLQKSNQVMGLVRSKDANK